MLTIEEGAIRKWDVEGAKAECTGEASPGELQLLWSGALASYSPDLAATAGGNNVQLWDLRTMALAGDIQVRPAQLRRPPSFSFFLLTRSARLLVQAACDARAGSRHTSWPRAPPCLVRHLAAPQER